MVVFFDWSYFMTWTSVSLNNVPAPNPPPPSVHIVRKAQMEERWGGLVSCGKTVFQLRSKYKKHVDNYLQRVSCGHGDNHPESQWPSYHANV